MPEILALPAGRRQRDCSVVVQAAAAMFRNEAPARVRPGVPGEAPAQGFRPSH